MKLLRLAKHLLLGLLLTSITAVLTFRWVDPPASAFMVQDLVEDVKVKQRWVPIERVSRSMIKAIIASEDQNFEQHYGFDLEAIEKALQHNQKIAERPARRKRNFKGASTLTQQTAKNMFLWRSRSWLRKGLEVYFTVLMEVLWPKKRIAEVYLNTAEFGKGIYGVESAAQQYFGKSASELTLDESALLTAVLPSPKRFKVNNPSPYVLQRKEWIINQVQMGPGNPDW